MQTIKAVVCWNQQLNSAKSKEEHEELSSSDCKLLCCQGLLFEEPNKKRQKLGWTKSVFASWCSLQNYSKVTVLFINVIKYWIKYRKAFYDHFQYHTNEELGH